MFIVIKYCIAGFIGDIRIFGIYKSLCIDEIIVYIITMATSFESVLIEKCCKAIHHLLVM